MKIEILTLFPEICNTFLSESIIGRAREKGLLDIKFHNIRDYSTDKHRSVDDYPYGGGQGMLMQAEPIYNCYKSITEGVKSSPLFIYMSPKGKRLTQSTVKKLAERDHLIILCGHYEGVDQRLLDKLKPLEISIGDYVLTGGELPAMVLTDAVCRIVPDVLSVPEAFSDESHFSGLLEYPQYTRPPVWEGMEVPGILLSGHHKNIKEWQNKESLKMTEELRNDMYIKWDNSHKE